MKHSKAVIGIAILVILIIPTTVSLESGSKTRVAEDDQGKSPSARQRPEGLDTLLSGSGSYPQDGYGTCAVVLDNWNGDGHPALAISSPGTDGAEADSGAVHIFYDFLNASSLDPDLADQVLAGESSQGAFGTSMDAGDLTNDGLVDLVVGEPGWNGGAGRVRIIPNPVSAQSDILVDVPGSDALGTSVAVVMDVNKDGGNDLVAGSPGNDKVILWFGDADGGGSSSSLFADLSDDDPVTTPNVVDFTSLNTIANTWDVGDSGDDGWDWANPDNGQYLYGQSEGQNMVTMGDSDPVNGPSETSILPGTVMVEIGGSNREYADSGAWGVQFMITTAMMELKEKGCQFTVSFDWQAWDRSWLNDPSSATEESCWVKCRFYGEGDTDHHDDYLGWNLDGNAPGGAAPGDLTPEIMFECTQDGNTPWHADDLYGDMDMDRDGKRNSGHFVWDITDMITASGWYHLDFGARFDCTQGRQSHSEGIVAVFDNVSAGIKIGNTPGSTVQILGMPESGFGTSVLAAQPQPAGAGECFGVTQDPSRNEVMFYGARTTWADISDYANGGLACRSGDGSELGPVANHEADMTGNGDLDILTGTPGQARLDVFESDDWNAVSKSAVFRPMAKGQGDQTLGQVDALHYADSDYYVVGFVNNVLHVKDFQNETVTGGQLTGLNLNMVYSVSGTPQNQPFLFSTDGSTFVDTGIDCDASGDHRASVDLFKLGVNTFSELNNLEILWTGGYSMVTVMVDLMVLEASYRENSEPVATIQGEAGSGFGSSIAWADLDGDGQDDLAVGSPTGGSNNRGYVNVYPSGPDLRADGSYRINGTLENGLFGTFMTTCQYGAVSDLILVGAPGALDGRGELSMVGLPQVKEVWNFELHWLDDPPEILTGTVDLRAEVESLNRTLDPSTVSFAYSINPSGPFEEINGPVGNSGGVLNVTWDTRTVVDGAYWLSVSANSTANNHAQNVTQSFVTVNNTLIPEMHFDPSLPVEVSGEIDLNVMVLDPSDNVDWTRGIVMEYSSDNLTWSEIGSNSSPVDSRCAVSWDTTDVPTGPQTIRASCMFGPGTVMYIFADILINKTGTTSPSISLDSPSPGDVLKGIVDIVMTLTPGDAGLNGSTLRVEVSPEVGGWMLVGESSGALGNQVSIEWNTTEFSNGTYLIRATFQDNDGMFANMTLGGVVTVANEGSDMSNLPPSLMMLFPQGGETISGGVEIKTWVYDPDGNITDKGVDFFVSPDSQNWEHVGTTQKTEPRMVGDVYVMYWQCGDYTAADHIWVGAVATDDGGTTGYAVSNDTVTIDRNPPVGPLLVGWSFSEGDEFAGQMDMGVRIIDGNGDLDAGNVRLSMAQNGTDDWMILGYCVPGEDDWFNISIDTAEHENGGYDLKVDASDHGGRLLQARSPGFVIYNEDNDLTKPEIEISIDDTGESRTKRITVSVSEDSETPVDLRVYVSDDGSIWAPLGTASFSDDGSAELDWDTTGMVDGDYRIMVEVVDASGNTWQKVYPDTVSVTADDVDDQTDDAPDDDTGDDDDTSDDDTGDGDDSSDPEDDKGELGDWLCLLMILIMIIVAVLLAVLVAMRKRKRHHDDDESDMPIEVPKVPPIRSTGRPLSAKPRPRKKTPPRLKPKISSGSDRSSISMPPASDLKSTSVPLLPTSEDARSLEDELAELEGKDEEDIFPEPLDDDPNGEGFDDMEYSLPGQSAEEPELGDVSEVGDDTVDVGEEGDRDTEFEMGRDIDRDLNREVKRKSYPDDDSDAGREMAWDDEKDISPLDDPDVPRDIDIEDIVADEGGDGSPEPELPSEEKTVHLPSKLRGGEEAGVKRLKGVQKSGEEDEEFSPHRVEEKPRKKTGAISQIKCRCGEMVDIPTKARPYRFKCPSCGRGGTLKRKR